MKNIKKIIITLTTILLGIFCTPAIAQIQVGGSRISKEEMARFKQSTTYFILQERDYERLEDFQAAIAKVWTVTPFKIIRYGEMQNLNPQQSSFFFFGGFVTVRRGQSTTTYHTHLSYNLTMLKEAKKGKLKEQLFGKFLLHLNSESYGATMSFATDPKRFSERLIPYMYKEAEMENWNPVMVSGYLKGINDGLQQEKLRSANDEIQNKEALRQLKSDTLYIPTYVNIKFNMFTGAEKDAEEDTEELKSAYPYPARYVSKDEFDRITKERPEGVWYLSYIKSSTDKYVGIFNSKTGDMIMNFCVPISYNFKMKDMRRVATKVKS